jgi:hypothetical protein
MRSRRKEEWTEVSREERARSSRPRRRYGFGFSKEDVKSSPTDVEAKGGSRRIRGTLISSALQVHAATDLDEREVADQETKGRTAPSVCSTSSSSLAGRIHAWDGAR